MATTKGRITIVQSRNLEQLADAANAAIEVLEASDFVAQSCETRDEIDQQGLPINIATITSVHADFMPLGTLTADAAGRSRMEAGYFGLVPASLAHFADAFWAASATARGKFADGLWDNTALAKFAAGLFSADDTARAKFAASFFGAGSATALALFQDAFWAATDGARAKFAASFFGAGSATALALFQDAFWAASDAARAKFADGFFSGLVAIGKFADGFLPAVKLNFEPVADVGRKGGGTFYFAAGGMAAGETLTLQAGLGGELWTGRAVPDPLLHEFLVTGVAAADCAAFVAAVNAGAACTVPTLFRAVEIGGDCAAVFAISNATVAGLAEATANVVVSQSVAGVAASDKRLAFGSYTVDAADVAIWVAAAANEVNISGAIPSVLPPTLLSTPRIRVPLGGTELFAAGPTFRFVQSGANEYVLVATDAAALLGVGDVITYAVLTD